jgi:hypothetical protein
VSCLSLFSCREQIFFLVRLTLTPILKLILITDFGDPDQNMPAQDNLINILEKKAKIQPVEARLKKIIDDVTKQDDQW